MTGLERLNEFEQFAAKLREREKARHPAPPHAAYIDLEQLRVHEQEQRCIRWLEAASAAYNEKWGIK